MRYALAPVRGGRTGGRPVGNRSRICGRKPPREQGLDSQCPPKAASAGTGGESTASNNARACIRGNGERGAGGLPPRKIENHSKVIGSSLNKLPSLPRPDDVGRRGRDLTPATRSGIALFTNHLSCTSE